LVLHVGCPMSFDGGVLRSRCDVYDELHAMRRERRAGPER
jgi:hypothetical protein